MAATFLRARNGVCFLDSWPLRPPSGAASLPICEQDLNSALEPEQGAGAPGAHGAAPGRAAAARGHHRPSDPVEAPGPSPPPPGPAPHRAYLATFHLTAGAHGLSSWPLSRRYFPEFRELKKKRPENNCFALMTGSHFDTDTDRSNPRGTSSFSEHFHLMNGCVRFPLENAGNWPNMFHFNKIMM